MLTLINTNRMVPPIAPVGLEYVAAAARAAGIDVRVVDLCLADDPERLLRDHFASSEPLLVGLSFRNVDDCFWPSAKWFVPELKAVVGKVKLLTDAPVVLGGVGFSVFPDRIVEYTGAEFGIRGDGEQATVALYNALRGRQSLESVDGLIRRANGRIHVNPPAWPKVLTLPTSRDQIDNRTYFEKGGQGGIETKRGCDRRCIYCADPLAKGAVLRLRNPAEIADEVEALIRQGVNVLHLCDGEFNIPRRHAMAVCEEFIRRSLAEKVIWYTYMSVVPFDAELAQAMRGAGCVGIDFTTDSASPAMLRVYRQRYRPEDIRSAVRLCRENGITVMLDLLLGGPGETPETARQTIEFVKGSEPDCVGAPLGVRIYPGTGMVDLVARQGPAEGNPSIRRKYTGPIDYFQPTFYISSALGGNPARLIKDLIGGDKRFFEPTEEVLPHQLSAPDGSDLVPGGGTSTGPIGAAQVSTDHNYNDNTELVAAIAAGARGAYWNILRSLRAQ